MSDRIPVIEVSPLGDEPEIVMVPVEDIDDFLGSIGSEYDLGLGELTTELGAVKVGGKVSVNVKAKAPAKKPAPKKPAPKAAPKPKAAAPKKPAPKPAPKPAAKAPPKPGVSKPTAKPVAKPVSKAPAGKKPLINIKAKIPVIKITAKSKSPVSKPAAKPTAAKKPAAKSPFGAIGAASKALTKVSASLAKSIQAKAKPTLTVKASVVGNKPAVVKTTIKPGAFLKITPKPVATVKAAAVVSKVASLAPKISSMPASAQKSLAAAVSGKLPALVVRKPASRTPALLSSKKSSKKPAPRKMEPIAVVAPPRLAALAAPVIPSRPTEPVAVVAPPRLAALAAPVIPALPGKGKVPRPIADILARLGAAKPYSCPCVVASKKPAAAAINAKPELKDRVAQIVNASKLAPADFQSQVLTVLKQLEACDDVTLRNKLRRLSRATGVLNVTA